MLSRSGVFNLSARVPLASGVTVIIATESDPEKILALLARHRITYIYLVPFILQRLLQLPATIRMAYDLSSLRRIIHTGAPCPRHVKLGLIEWLGPIVDELYGATEGGFTYISSEEWLKKPGSVGRAAGRASILNEDGRVLPVGEIGLIYFNAPETGRFEYLNSPEKTRSAYCGDRFTLGDCGYIDEDGYLFLTGRSEDVIVLSTGWNVYPAEVENVLIQHSAIEDAVVYGTPHPEMGEEIRALLQLRNGKTADDAIVNELESHCRLSLAAFKCPSKFEFATEIPRMPTGKINRRRIQQRP
jgi:long-chain acyl-CoA synthetase